METKVLRTLPLEATPLTQKRKRRKYAPGRCQDCGWEKRVTEIIFWVNGMKYRVCRACIKPYRGRILR